MSALNELLTGLVDFAGLFPPAAMDMESAVRAYADYRVGPHAAYLGAFVVPAGRLDEFAGAAGRVGRRADHGPGGARSWPVSVLAGEPPDADVARALRFSAPPGGEQGLTVVALETRALSAATVDRVSAAVPGDVSVAFEIPLSLGRDERRALLAAVKAAGRIAKIRTGGVTPEAIPPAIRVAEFIWDCACAGVAFKATAGLHHPVRAEQRLTYAADSPRAVMHGFVNVFVAAAAAWALAGDEANRAADEPPAAVTGVLEERNPLAFAIAGDTLHWRDLAVPAADIERARRKLARSFGSCSFDETVGDLQALGWLP